MSHEEQHAQQHHHLPTTGTAADPPPQVSSSTGYGPSPTPPPYPYSPREPNMSRPAAAAAEATAPAVAPAPSGTAADPLRLTAIERWAQRASDSQFNATAGAIGGFTSGIVTCPLDVIKTKLQAQGGFTAVQKGRHVGHHKVYQGLVGTARVIWREEGIRGMYRGLGPIILGYLPTWAVWFTVYNKSKVYLGQYYHNSVVVNFWSSIIAGASSTIVTNPIWVIKTRLMSQMSRHSRAGYSVFPKGANTPTSRPTLHAPWHYSSTLDAARKMYTQEGVLSFYSGLTPALLGLTHVAVQFPAYEYLKTKFTGKGMGDSGVENGEQPAHWFGILSATILSKIMASSATYPHEVIRTRLQTQRRPAPGVFEHPAEAGAEAATAATTQQQPRRHVPKYRGVVMTFRTILREEGWRAFYAGMGTNMMRAVPAATVTMLTYEYVMRTLRKAQFDGRRKLEEAAAAAAGERTGYS